VKVPPSKCYLTVNVEIVFYYKDQITDWNKMSVDTAAKRVVRKNEKFNVPDQTEEEEAETWKSSSRKSSRWWWKLKEESKVGVTKQEHEFENYWKIIRVG